MPTAIRPRQFSLRSLFVLTLVTSLLLTLGVWFSPWEPAAILIPLTVWWLDRAKIVKRTALARFSFLLFIASLCLPAVALSAWNDPDMFWGWQAFAISFAVLPQVFFGSWLSEEPEEIHWALIYLIGAAANTSFLGAYAAHLFPSRFARVRRAAMALAFIAVVLATANGLLLLFTAEFRGVYPGLGCWIAGMLALYLGLRKPKPAPYAAV